MDDLAVICTRNSIETNSILTSFHIQSFHMRRAGSADSIEFCRLFETLRYDSVSIEFFIESFEIHHVCQLYDSGLVINFGTISIEFCSNPRAKSLFYDSTSIELATGIVSFDAQQKVCLLLL